MSLLVLFNILRAAGRLETRSSHALPGRPNWYDGTGSCLTGDLVPDRFGHDRPPKLVVSQRLARDDTATAHRSRIVCTAKNNQTAPIHVIS
jgi:hypothetical protein